MRFADGVLGDVAAGEDVVQAAFVRLWNRREGLSAEGSVRSLLYTMTRNAALDERRRVGRHEAAVRDIGDRGGPPTPLDETVGEDVRSAAARAVAALPPQRREVFRLVREEGLAYKEVARVTGLSPQTVANHMSLALRDLRAALADHLEEGR